MDANRNKGGRGKKASYESTHCRIPLPLKTFIDQLANKYRELVLNYEDPEDTELLEGTIQSLSNNSSTNEKLETEIKSLEIKLKLARQRSKEFEQQLAKAEQDIYHLQNGGAIKILTDKLREQETINYQLRTTAVTGDKKSIVSEAIAKFIEGKQKIHGKNNAQKQKEFSLNTRGWDVFREFMRLFE